MLEYKQAIKKILINAPVAGAKALPLRECLGLVAACDVYSSEPLPSFDNSAVDGYAVCGIKNNSKFKVLGEISAGDFFKGKLKPGQAMQIFTGAPVPQGTEAVVMQEWTERQNGTVTVLKQLDLQDNVRFSGEDIQKGNLLIKRGTLLEPSHLAVLAAVGHESIQVIPAPSVAILATGSELLKTGQKIAPGKIRDSNSILIEALVKKTGAVPHVYASVGDDFKKIQKTIRQGLAHDFLIISGGVSVGKYDYVKEILKEEKVEEIFWKVNIKPGKPLFFGKKEKTLVFGLPGNPVSVFVTFQEFVKPAMLKTMGAKNIFPDVIEGKLTRKYENGSRLHFVRVACTGEKKLMRITPLKGQGSHMLGSLAMANALLTVKENAVLKKNQIVSVKRIG